MKLSHAHIVVCAHACLVDLKAHRDSLIECNSLLGEDGKPDRYTLDSDLFEEVTRLGLLIEAIEGDE